MKGVVVTGWHVDTEAGEAGFTTDQETTTDKTDVERFAEVEQSMDFQLEFPSGAVANCHTSYDETGNLLRVEAENGWYTLEPAYEYKGIREKQFMGQ